MSGALAVPAAVAPPMVLVPTPPEPPGGRWWHRLAGALGDVAVLLLFSVLFPFAILALGTPIALLVWVLIEVMDRL